MSMISRSSAFFLMLASLVGFALFQVKYEVQSLEEGISKTLHLMAEEKEALHILKAEWAYLNEPRRLQALAEKFLDIEPVKAQQMATILTAFEPTSEGPLPQGDRDPEVQAILASMRMGE
ncbi:putative secreted (periplasmic) protein [Candidatus Bealeia paramacronuclearis]|uniref:Secreted (Periplasmic) protein n=1 Tax=Candidatus Bealeia paramacronuclearis TaxID=1921001 RepID=A0ABZ2C068_9PROT|nr:putative secreted (periplasmic) protein [Candidatus Bealeia paramacronuclearis]